MASSEHVGIDSIKNTESSTERSRGISDSEPSDHELLKTEQDNNEVASGTIELAGDESDISGDEEEEEYVPIENTYQLKPDPSIVFNGEMVRERMLSVMREVLGEKEYSAEECRGWTRAIADRCKAALKELNMDRYKLMTLTTISEKREQGIRMAWRTHWDPNTDYKCYAEYENNSFHCNVLCFAVYTY